MSEIQPTPDAQGSPAPDPSTPHTPGSSQASKDKRTFVRLAVIAGGVLGTAIAATALAVELIDKTSGSSSSAATLSIERAEAADPYAESRRLGEVLEWELPQTWEHAIDWRIPVDAPFETFPMNFVNTGTEENVWLDCSDEQFAWLEQHAEPFDAFSDVFNGKFYVTLRNTASDSGALPLGNIRFEGEEVGSTPWVYLECTNGGRGNVGLGQPLLIDITGAEAVYGEPLRVDGEDIMPVGSPVTVNLAPGEIAELVLTRADTVDKQTEYQGRFLADILDGSEETVVLAENVHFMRDRIPGYKIHYVGADYDNSPGEPGDLLCVRNAELPYAERDQRVCTLDEVVEMLREAEETVK